MVEMTQAIRDDFNAGIHDFITDILADYPTQNPAEVVAAGFLALTACLEELLPEQLLNATFSVADTAIVELFGDPARSEDEFADAMENLASR